MGSIRMTMVILPKKKKMPELFQRLGNLYMESGNNKFNYIYSAGLFAAAAVRNPEKHESIYSDMQILWQKLLTEANALNANSTFLEITRNVKASFMSLRDDVSNLLNEVPQVQDNAHDKQDQERSKIFFIQEVLLAHISEQYIVIMKSISDICCSILFNGEPPCKFSHVALGSLARQDATVYSDFENMILIDNNVLNDDYITDRFKWYSVIFQMIIIGLEESPLRLLGIPALNDFTVKDKSKDWFYDYVTKCGIQFDSNESNACVHPLGRQISAAFPLERGLIKSVADMVSYIFKNQLEKESEADTEDSDFHLSNVLSRSAFVAGDEGLYNQYKDAVNQRLDENQDKIVPMLTKSLKSFDSLDELCGGKQKPAIKNLMFRASTLLISYIGNLLQIREPNCFAIIDILIDTQRISEEAGHNLKYAVAVANEVRMKVYKTANEQVREVDLRLPSTSKASALKEIVGKRSILDFFDIIRCLWLSLRRFVFGQQNIQDSGILRGSMRGGSESATRAVYASLGLLIDRSELSEEEKLAMLGDDPLAGGLADAVPLAKVFSLMLVDVFRDMVAMISKYDDFHCDDEKVRLQSDEKFVVFKCEGVLNAVQDCNLGFAQRSDLNPKPVSTNADIAERFFEPGCNNQDSTEFRQFVASVQKVQRLVNGYIEDRYLASQLPNVLHLIFKIADFTSNFRHFKKLFLSALENKKVSKERYNALDRITSSLKETKLQLEQLKYTTNDWVTPNKILQISVKMMDDGFFDFDDLEDGIGEWPDRVDVTKNNLLKINEFKKAINDKNPIFLLIFEVKDWAFILNAYSKVVIRDVALCMGEITELKARYEFLEGDYDLAMEKYRQVENCLCCKENYRPKNHHKKKIAENKKAIALCYLQMGNVAAALSQFRDELNYRFEKLKKRTSTEQTEENLRNQNLCLERLKKEEQE